MLDDLREKLSILTCRYFFDGYFGKEEVEIANHKREVYIFDGFYSGFSTIWGDLLLNRRLFEDGMESALKTVLLHEIQHEKESKVKQALVGTLQMLLYPASILVSAIAIISLGALSVFQPSVLPEYFWPEVPFYIALLYAFISPISKLSELKTDLAVVDSLSPKKFREGREQLRESFPVTGIGRISVLLSHPSKETVLKVHRMKTRN